MTGLAVVPETDSEFIDRLNQNYIDTCVALARVLLGTHKHHEIEDYLNVYAPFAMHSECIDSLRKALNLVKSEELARRQSVRNYYKNNTE